MKLLFSVFTGIACVAIITAGCNNKRQDTDLQTCTVCDRIALFQQVKQNLADKYWTSLDSKKFIPPLLYFSDSTCWLAFSDTMAFKDRKYEKLHCQQGVTLYKFARIDSTPFHMENKMDFGDTKSPCYFHPIMFCSDVETTHKMVPEVINTEEWLQLVMHEYFHAFQFSHKNCINYLANNIKVHVDSLHNYYRKNEWFKQYAKTENDYLLKAVNTTARDSVLIYYKLFTETRKLRRAQFTKVFGYDITLPEKFWEKIEGTARYAEYNMGYVYTTLTGKDVSQSCDTSFNQFKNYHGQDFARRPWFQEKTEMMVAYYYVTGFNLCRVLDRLGIKYKYQLFDNMDKGLEDFADMR